MLSRYEALLQEGQLERREEVNVMRL